MSNSEIMKRVIANLAAGRRHSVRIRAINSFGTYSDWSEALDFVTPLDDSVPAAPQNLVIDFDTPDLALQWDPVETNSDGSPIMDLAGYEITMRANNVAIVRRTTQPFMIHPFARNVKDFGIASPVIAIEVRAVDVGDNKSEPVIGTAVNEPPKQPQAPTGFATVTMMAVSMTPHPDDIDIKDYLVERSTSDSGPFTQVGVSGGDTFIDTGLEYATYYYRYKVRDHFGQESPVSTVLELSTTGQFQLDDVPPEQVDDFIVVGSGIDPITRFPYVDLSWTPNNVDSDLSYFEIRALRSGDSFVVSTVVGPGASSYRLGNLQPDSTYTLAMYAYDHTGNRSALSGEIIINTPDSDTAPDTITATGAIHLDANGYINNAAYRTDPTTGWELGNNGLIVNDGVIKGSALQIGVSSENLLTNSAFTEGTTVASDWSPTLGGGADATYEISNTFWAYLGRSQFIDVTSGGSWVGVRQDVSRPSGEPFIPDETIAVSAWIRQETGTSRNAKIFVQTPAGATLWDGFTENLSIGGWTRVTAVFRLAASQPTLRIGIRINSPVAGDEFYIDGAQCQISDYITDYAPRTLEIPTNYIQSANIASLSAGKITSGQIATAELIMTGAGTIRNDPQTWKIDEDGALFENGSITLIGAGDSGAGYVKMDGSSLRLISGTVDSPTNTRFKADSTGVYIGGNDSTNAQVYFDAVNDKTIFQSSGTGYTFTIDTDPADGKILKVTTGGATPVDNFYLDTDGQAYFLGGVVGSEDDDDAVKIWPNNIVAGGLTNALELAGGSIYKLGAGGVFELDGTGLRFWSNATKTGDPSIELNAGTGDAIFRGELIAASGSFAGNITGGTINIGTRFSVDSSGNLVASNVDISGNIEASRVTTSSYIDGAWNEVDVYQGRIDIKRNYSTVGRLQALVDNSGSTNGYVALTYGASSPADTFHIGLIVTGNGATLMAGAGNEISVMEQNHLTISSQNRVDLSGSSVRANGYTVLNTSNHSHSNSYPSFVTLSVTSSWTAATFGGRIEAQDTIVTEGDLASVGHGTTTQAANTYILSSSGRIVRSTSVAASKRDIEDLDPEYNKVLDLRPVWFRSNCEADPADWSFYGLVAEEVFDIDPRLATSDLESRELIGVNYGHIGVLLQPYVKKHEQEIAELKQLVADILSSK